MHQHLVDGQRLADAVVRAGGEGHVGKRGRVLSWSGAKRSGMNFSGSLQNSGWRCTKYGLKNTSVPGGTVKPASWSASMVRRDTTHTGGYSRMASRTTCWSRAALPSARGTARFFGAASISACSFASTSGCCAEQVPGPVQRAGSGFVAGDDECDDLVHELASVMPRRIPCRARSSSMTT